MEGFGGNQWRIDIDLKVGKNTYFILEETTIEYREYLFNIGFKECIDFVLGIYDSDGCFKEITISEHDMINNPMLFEMILKNKPYKPFPITEYNFNPKGLYDEICNMIYSYTNHHEQKIRYEKKCELYNKLYDEVLSKNIK